MRFGAVHGACETGQASGFFFGLRVRRLVGAARFTLTLFGEISTAGGVMRAAQRCSMRLSM